MKRGGFLNRRTPLKAKVGLKTTKPMKKRGRKTNEWDKLRANKIKPAFKMAGIVTCEIQLPGCWHDNGLGFCHRKKRRFCDSDELKIVALGCNFCHDILESKPHEEMFEFINNIIKSRQRKIVIP